MPKTTYTAEDFEGLVEELERKAEEDADEMGAMSSRIDELEIALNLPDADGKGGLADRVDELADRVDELEAAVASAESEREYLERRIYDLESDVGRIQDRLHIRRPR